MKNVREIMLNRDKTIEGFRRLTNATTVAFPEKDK